MTFIDYYAIAATLVILAQNGFVIARWIKGMVRKGQDVAKS